jgi:Ran GTPase-activating protein (RanGAP) involved in mRNA processing and transport
MRVSCEYCVAVRCKTGNCAPAVDKPVISSLMHAPCQVLRRLCLEHNHIGKEGADALGNMLQTNVTLQALLLGSNVIRDEGLLHISQGIRTPNSAMRLLAVEANSITPNGARLLAKCLFAARKLDTLRLSNNALGGDGAAIIGEGLRYTASLTHLDLSGNLLGDKGVTSFLRCFKIVPGGLGKRTLPANTALQTLDLTKNNLSDEACFELMRAVARHKYVYQISATSRVWMRLLYAYRHHRNAYARM